MFSAPQNLSQSSSRAGSNHVHTCPRCCWRKNTRTTAETGSSILRADIYIWRGAGTHTKISKYTLIRRGSLTHYTQTREESGTFTSPTREAFCNYLLLRCTRQYISHLRLKTKLNCQVQQPISGSSPRSLAKDRPSWMIFRRSTLHLSPRKNLHGKHMYIKK